ncbi:NXN protein [Aphelenchoides avenae]|nr:NXN protein [Aphelenchus avenae]
MLRKTYESCLKECALLRLSPQEGTGADGSGENCIALETVFTATKYVVFHFFRDGSPELLERLRHLAQVKNTSDSSSTTSSPAKIKKFLGLRKSKKKLESSNTPADVAFVLFDIDAGKPFATQGISEPGFYSLSPPSYTVKTRLLRSLGYACSPSVIVVDTDTLQVTTSQGRRSLLEDPEGTAFPWTDPDAASAFQGAFLRWSDSSNQKTLQTAEFSSLSPCVKGIYFGAKWCPPCRVFKQQLVSAYKQMKSSGHPFEIFFCSSDRTQESFQEHFSSMPWLAFPFDQDVQNTLTRAYNISGIPTFIIVDENHRVITQHGRSVLLSDPKGQWFPWRSQPFYELTELTLHRISDAPSMILFTEGTPEDNEFAVQLLNASAEWLKTQSPWLVANEENGGGTQRTTGQGITDSSADTFQLFYTGADPVCDHILDILGLGDAELPLLVICDTLVGYLAVCDKPDVSEAIAIGFIKDYWAGQLRVTPLPQPKNERRVGGIPVNLIEQIITNRQNAAAGK